MDILFRALPKKNFDLRSSGGILGRVWKRATRVARAPELQRPVFGDLGPAPGLSPQLQNGARGLAPGKRSPLAYL
jgi:hypothetical protein